MNAYTRKPFGEFAIARFIFEPTQIDGELNAADPMDQFCACCGDTVAPGEGSRVAMTAHCKQVDMARNLYGRAVGMSAPCLLLKERTLFICRACSDEHSSEQIALALLEECTSPFLLNQEVPA